MPQPSPQPQRKLLAFSSMIMAQSPLPSLLRSRPQQGRRCGRRCPLLGAAAAAVAGEGSRRRPGGEGTPQQQRMLLAFSLMIMA